MKLFANILSNLKSLHKGIESVWSIRVEDVNVGEPKQGTYVAPANRFSDCEIVPSFKNGGSWER